MRKKVSIVLGHAVSYPFHKTGGIEKVFFGIFEAFEDQEFHYTLIAKSNNDKVSKISFAANKTLLLLPGFTWSQNKILNVWNSFIWCLGVQKHLVGQDVVIYNSIFGPFVHYFNRQKSICTYCDQRGVSKIKGILIKGFMVRRIYCISEYVKRTWPATLYSKCKMIPNGVDIYSFSFKPSSKVLDCLKLLFVGRIVPEKGLVILIEAIIILLREYNVSCKLEIIGPWLAVNGGSENYYQECVKKIREFGLQDLIHFEGEKNSAEIVQSMQFSEIFICSSIWEEAFGIVNIEALSCGLPVIAFSTGALPEIIFPNKNGLLVNEKSPEALALAIYIYSTFSEIVKIGMKSYARGSAERYDYRKIASEYLMDISYLVNNKAV